MKFSIFVFALILTVMEAAAATTPEFFPEAAAVGAQDGGNYSGFEEPSGLTQLAQGQLIAAVGFVRYDRHDYASDGNPLTIEVFTLSDTRAAYSLLTLLGNGPVISGPPGDARNSAPGELIFAQGRRLIRIREKGAVEQRLKTVAGEVEKRLQKLGGDIPGLPARLPQSGYDVASMRYFPSATVLQHWMQDSLPAYIDTSYDMEIARARYTSAEGSGWLTLLRFPNPELAEEYYDSVAPPAGAVNNALSLYARRSGPIIAYLESNFPTVTADKLLQSIKFSYSVRWVFDRGNRTGIVWGIPGSVLGAVVNSIIFSVLFGAAAILIGLAIGASRFALRNYREKRDKKPITEDSGFTRLNLP